MPALCPRCAEPPPWCSVVQAPLTTVRWRYRIGVCSAWLRSRGSQGITRSLTELPDVPVIALAQHRVQRVPVVGAWLKFGPRSSHPGPCVVVFQAQRGPQSAPRPGKARGHGRDVLLLTRTAMCLPLCAHHVSLTSPTCVSPKQRTWSCASTKSALHPTPSSPNCSGTSLLRYRYGGGVGRLYWSQNAPSPNPHPAPPPPIPAGGQRGVPQLVAKVTGYSTGTKGARRIIFVHGCLYP